MAIFREYYSNKLDAKYKYEPTECLDVSLAPQFVCILRLGILGEVALGQREVVRRESYFQRASLLHRVNTSDVLRQIGARSSGVVTLVLNIGKIFVDFVY